MQWNPLTPFEPVSTQRFPVGEQWIAQVKFDGVRVLTYYDGTEVRLFNRRLNERTNHYPELTAISSYCSAKSVILDGEVVAFEQGKPSFYQVMKRDGIRNLGKVRLLQTQVPVAYMVFDILYVNGEWVTSRPLSERVTLLSDVIHSYPHVQCVETFSDVEGLYQAVQAQGLEGVVIKDLESSYLVDGKDSRWQKRKYVKDLIAIVGGVTFKDGRVNALLLGLYDESGQLVYIGKAGSGKLSHRDWSAFTEVVKGIVQDNRPFANDPRLRGVTWLQPILTVKVQFLEWRQGNALRHPTIQSFVAVEPATCRFDAL